MKAKLLLRDDAGDPVEVVDARQCDSKDHEPRLAVWRLFWATGPAECCAPCAERLRSIGSVLGFHVHSEEIPLPESKQIRRAIDFNFCERT